MSLINIRPYMPDDAMSGIAGLSRRLPYEADVVVIGGGIMGLASAYYLAARGQSVIVLERDRLASQQSGRNWGFVRTQYRDAAEMELAIGALSIWRGLERELGLPIGWRETGCLFAARDEAEATLFENWVNQTASFGGGAVMLSGQETADRLPHLARAAAGALYTATDGQAEPQQATCAFAHAARLAGAQIFEDCGVLAIEDDGGAVSAVLTEHGAIRTKVVICAAGAMSHRLLRPLGLHLPQQVVRNTVSLTRPLPVISVPSFCGFGIGLRQRADGSCIISAESESDVDLTLGSFRDVGFFMSSYLANRRNFKLSFGRAFFDDLYERLVFDRRQRSVEPRRPHLPANLPRASQIAKMLGDLFGLSGEVGIERSWAGAIDALPDAIPVIDGETGVSGLVVATGFSGHGFGLGPAIGKAVADIVMSGRSTFDLAPFRLDRFVRGTFGQPHAPL